MAIELARQIESIRPDTYAIKVKAKRPTNAVALCFPIEKLFTCKHLFTSTNRQLLLRLMSEGLGHAEASWQGGEVPSNEVALEREMQQLIDIVRKEIVEWRFELRELTDEDESAEHE